MKKAIIIASFVLCTLTLHSQGIINGFTIENFPEVSFDILSYNPDTLIQSDIQIFEDGKRIPVNKLDLIQDIVVERKKNILFLCDLNINNGFVVEVLHDLFNRMDIKDSLTFVNVATFYKEDGNDVYESIMDSFSSDLEKVRDKVVGWNLIPRSVPTISWALDNAVDQLQFLSEDEAKAIILFMSGPVSNDVAFETLSVCERAKKNRIQIYVVTIKGDENTKKLADKISHSTYGLTLFSEGFFSVKDKRNEEIMESKNPKLYTFLFPENEVINSWIKSLSRRWNGILYQITFISQFDRIGKTKQISIDLGNDTINTAYDIPGFSLRAWIKTHFILFIVLLLASLLVLGLGLFFLFRHLRNIAVEKIEKEEKMMEESSQLKKEQEILRKRIDCAESEYRIKQEIEDLNNKKQKREEYLESVRTLMKNKKIKARLLVTDMQGSYEFIVDVPEVTVGTADNNSIVLNDVTVSRRHALIYYDGETFCIRDLGSTNGIVMNGFKIGDMKLRTGDSVSLGNTVVKIYF